MSEKAKHRRVVITGLGCVSSLGIGKDEFWKNLIVGKSGISEVTSFDTSQYDRHYGGEVKNFDPAQFMSKAKAKRIGRASQMAIAASKLAIKDAQLTLNDEARKRTAVCIGTTMGEIGLLERLNDGRLAVEQVNFSENMAPSFPAHLLSLNVVREFKLQNKNCVFGNACSSGNYAVGYAYNLIRKGHSDFALAGGADCFSRILFTGFSRLGAIAPDVCRPFDKNRQGMIPGEGAAILVLESLDGALKRNAKIYAEILGCGFSSDAYHMTQPKPESVCKAIIKGLNASKIKPEDVDYISAHGTGTQENDKAECEAFGKVFGSWLPQIPVSSIKSMLGHTMGAAAAFESIACCLAIQHGEIPPTINHLEDDPGCPINCVPNKSIKKEIETVLNSSQAFGGSNAALFLKGVKE